MLILALSLLFTFIACGEDEPPTPEPEACTEHVDENEDLVCDVCEKCITHIDEDEDNICDVCEICLIHTDDDADDICDVCEECIIHTDEDEDGICDVCEACVEHYDEDEDGICDVCEACVEHYDEDEDGICDVCEGCTEHYDEDEDRFCDYCGERIGGKAVPTIKLIENGKALFQIVLEDGINIDIRKYADDFAYIFDDLGTEVLVVDDKTGNEAAIEILVGSVKSRGAAYEYNKYTLGPKGYAITALDKTKIAIVGGSDESLLKALEIFAEEYLGVTEDTKSLQNFTFSAKYDVVAPYTEYRITDITVDGNSVAKYVITKDPLHSETKTIAEAIRQELYERMGLWLPIVNDGDEASGTKAIRIKAVGKTEAGEKGFQIRISNGDLVFECGYLNKYLTMYEEYSKAMFPTKVTGVVALTAYTPTAYASRVSYKEFGAVGDGKTDDFQAIKRAHEFANQGGQDVVITEGGKYLIGVNPSTIQIKTNVDWGNATIIFDDTKLTGSNTKSVFAIAPDSADTTLRAGNKYFDALNNSKGEDGLIIRGVNHGENMTTKLDLGLGYPALLNVNDSSKEMYIRWGYVNGQIHTQEEIILIDKDGNIDPSTPFLMDYENVTSIVVQRLDNVEPITVGNATIETWSTKMNKAGNISHGIRIERSYTTVENLKRVVKNEYPGVTVTDRIPIKYDSSKGYWVDATKDGYKADRYNVYKDGQKYTGSDVVLMSGVTYTGYITVSRSHGVTVKNCEFQGREYYGSGTYDLNIYNANDAKFINCKQVNFFDTRDTYGGSNSTTANMSKCWGVMGSNYGKNLYFENCDLTRFDAHCGVYNLTMKEGKTSVIRLIGGGTATFDGVNFYSASSVNAPIQLREDYGATFNGTVIFKDCTLNSSGTIPGLIDAPTANWDNGYGTYFPNLVVDGLTLNTPQKELQLVTKTGQTYSISGEHYPSRDLITQNVHDERAKFVFYYETYVEHDTELDINDIRADIASGNPTIFPFLKGFTEDTKIVPSNFANLSGGKFMVIDHGNNTCTLIAAGVQNVVNPYHRPEYIEIKNMKGLVNKNGEKVTLYLYKSNFFDAKVNGKAVEIRDADGVLKRK